MRITRIVSLTLIGVMFILGACSSPAATPPTAQVPVATQPVPMPKPVTEVTAQPPLAVPLTPAPVSSSVPPQANAVTSAAVPITYSNMVIPPPVMSGGKVTGTVTVTVTNPGSEGTFQVTLQYLGDNDECPTFSDDIKNVTLAVGASADVTFPVSLDAAFASRFTLQIGQLKGLLVK